MAARLLSVNVGLQRDIAWRGKTVHTAVWKAPVQGRRMVRRLNIDGDGQGDLGGHGGEHRAVFVYQIESPKRYFTEMDQSGLPYRDIKSISGKMRPAFLDFEVSFQTEETRQ